VSGVLATINPQLTVQREVKICMADFVRERDSIFGSIGRNLLTNAGSISHAQAENKAKLEDRKYRAKTLDKVEGDYLKSIASLEKRAKSGGRKKGGEA
jgi:hypothetical protein